MDMIYFGDQGPSGTLTTWCYGSCAQCRISPSLGPPKGLQGPP